MQAGATDDFVRGGGGDIKKLFILFARYFELKVLNMLTQIIRIGEPIQPPYM